MRIEDKLINIIKSKLYKEGEIIDYSKEHENAFIDLCNFLNKESNKYEYSHHKIKSKEVKETDGSFKQLYKILNVWNRDLTGIKWNCNDNIRILYGGIRDLLIEEILKLNIKNNIESKNNVKNRELIIMSLKDFIEKRWSDKNYHQDYYEINKFFFDDTPLITEYVNNKIKNKIIILRKGWGSIEILKSNNKKNIHIKREDTYNYSMSLIIKINIEDKTKISVVDLI